jgi:predicted transcriptional regulator
MAEGNRLPVEGSLLAFFKALADASRLRIVGLLARESLSVEQLAEMLELRPSTVSHHLAKLAEAGLVSARAESYYNIYQLEQKNLEEMARRLLSKEIFSEAAAGVDREAYDRKVWRDYQGADGKLKSIPTQRKKLDAILRRVVGDFELERIYSEQDVNKILGRYHEDTARLRRELVGGNLLNRDRRGTEYWRPVTSDKSPANP